MGFGAESLRLALLTDDAREVSAGGGVRDEPDTTGLGLGELLHAKSTQGRTRSPTVAPTMGKTEFERRWCFGFAITLF